MEYSKENVEFILECLDRSVKNQGWFEINCDNAEILQAEITRLQSEARWIPVSDRLPELKTDDLVLCVIKNDMRGTWVDTRTFWVASKLFSGSSQVTHWKYLPTPPTEG
jgi:hypothetical protein